MIQERVRSNLKGSGKVGGGGFPYDVRKKYIHTDIHYYTEYINVVLCSIFSRNWTLEK